MHWTRLPADPALADFAALRNGVARLLVRRGYEALAAELARGAPPESDVTVEGGRQPHPVIELEGGERAVVRAYRRGGAVRHLNRERYFLGHRAFAEARATERARTAGVRAPLVLAAAEYPAGIGYRAALATRWIPGAVELPRWLRESPPGARAGVLGEAGRQIARMHAGGVAHPDLNLRNLLVAQDGGSGPEVHVLDFDRARLFPHPVPSARRARDLLRLARSAWKIGAPIEPEAWRAFRDAYGPDWPLASDLG